MVLRSTFKIEKSCDKENNILLFLFLMGNFFGSTQCHVFCLIGNVYV